MNHAPAHLNPPTPPSRRRSAAFSGIAGLAVLAIVLGACGGDDDDGATATSSTTESTVASLPPAVVTTPDTTAPPLTAPPTTAALVLVTEGATVIVANASGVDGAAGRMTDALAVAGFTTGDATNSSESQLETTKVYYDPESDTASAVAESVRDALGGGDIEVLELTVPAPLSDPDSIGDAGVLIAMGNDTADKSLEDLQSGVADEGTADEDTADEGTADEGTADEDTTDG